MVTVGLDELEAHLSEYVRAAHAGETVLVTEGGEIVAALGPAAVRPLEAAPVTGDVEAKLAELERRGLLTRPKLPKQGWRWQPKGLGLPSEQIDSLLDDLRADRFEP